MDDFIAVDTDAICAALKDVFQDTRNVLEPAGALALAGAKRYIAEHKWKNKTVAVITSGANMNFDRLRFVAERADVGEAKEAIFAVTMPEIKGSFRQLCTALGARNVTEFNYRISDSNKAHVFVGVQINSLEEAEKVADRLRRKKFDVLDLTADDLAKSHLRYMVGGHSPLAENEVLYRFEFPERPGALMKFLNTMNPEWNISLFHYRNQGADYGRVLVGIQVPPSDKKAFKDFLSTIGYPFIKETDNPAYKLFL